MFVFCRKLSKSFAGIKKKFSNLKNIENYKILEKDIYDENTF